MSVVAITSIIEAKIEFIKAVVNKNLIEVFDIYSVQNTNAKVNSSPNSYIGIAIYSLITNQ